MATKFISSRSHNFSNILKLLMTKMSIVVFYLLSRFYIEMSHSLACALTLSSNVHDPLLRKIMMFTLSLTTVTNFINISASHCGVPTLMLDCC